MGYVYILQSERTGKYYIGSCLDLSRRIAEHNSGKTKSLKGHLPLKLVFKKEFPVIIEARQMEIKLKRLKSRQIIEQIVKDQKLNMGL